MHFCKNPFNVWSFYPPCDENGELNDFAEVEALGEVKTDDNMKFCTSKLRIGKKLAFTDFVNAGVKAILNDTESNTKTNTGNCSAATNTGNRSAATVEEKNSVAIVTGYGSKAKGVKGSWIVCTERDKNYNILCVKATEIDGEKIKENTFYTLKNGEFVKAEGNKQK